MTPEKPEVPKSSSHRWVRRKIRRIVRKGVLDSRPNDVVEIERMAKATFDGLSGQLRKTHYAHKQVEMDASDVATGVSSPQDAGILLLELVRATRPEITGTRASHFPRAALLSQQNCADILCGTGRPPGPRELPGMSETNDPYQSFLLAHKDKLFHRKPYPCNSGDVLIARGTEELLTRLGIRTTLNPREADIILYSGGNPTMWRERVGQMQEDFGRFTQARFVIGPCTVRFGRTHWAKVLAAGPVLGMFAREPASWANLQKAGLSDRTEIGLSVDPALYLRGTDWLAAQKKACLTEYVLAAFRGDHEAATKGWRWWSFLRPYMSERLRAMNPMDPSQIRRKKLVAVAKRIGAQDPIRQCDASGLDFDSFLECIRWAREVHTDRLHVMLFAAMLGKPVFAYQTGYGKLEAMYEYCLKPWANVTFVSVQ